TFAEEVYNQYARQESGGEADWRGLAARAVAVSLPAVALAWVLMAWAVRSWEKRLPPPGSLLAPPLQFALGRLRWPVLAVVLLAIGLLSAVPVGSLVWKSGLAGRPESWSLAATLTSFRTVLRVHGTMVVQSVGVAGLSGFCA